MFHLLNRLQKNNTGTATVEMAFVLPLFLLFVMGIIEFGRLYWTLNSMQLAVDEAGRYAMVHTASTDADITTVAQANLYGLNTADFTLTSASQITAGVTYKVITATYTFSFIASGILPFGSINLTRQTTVPLL